MMNNIEIFINNEINRMFATGSVLEPNIRNESISLIQNSSSLENIILELSHRFGDITKKILSSNNGDTNIITGITSCIYLPSATGEYKLKVLGGNTLRDKEFKVNDDTMYDVASITKLFTLVLLFKLEELGFIDLETKISDINKDITGLENYTINDLIRMHGILKTVGNVAAASTEEEAYRIFKTVHLEDNNRSKGTYTDFGAMVLSDTLEKVMSKALGRQITYDEIMDMFLFQPLGLKKTTFKPSTDNVSGSGYSKYSIHDRKARAIGRAIGSAGIFVTSDDIANLAKEIYTTKYINREHIARLGEITFEGSQKGNLGVYVKHPLGLAKTFVPDAFSTGSFAHQGWTGSVATFDPNNLMHQSILVNAIYESDDKDKVVADKPVGYGSMLDGYIIELNRITILMYLAKQYYNKQLHQNNDVHEKVII